MATGTSWAEQDRPFRLFIDEVMYPYPEMRWEPPPSEGVVDAGDPGGGSKTPRSRVRTTPIHGHERQVNCLAFNASGAQLASGSDDETARLWDAETSRCVLTLDGHGKGVAQLCWEPRSDRRLCTLCMDKTLRFFDARSGPRAVAAVKASQEYINVAWHHDAVTVAIGSSVGGAADASAPASKGGTTTTTTTTETADAASAAGGAGTSSSSKDSGAAVIKDCVTLVDARKAAASRRLRFTYEVNEFCWAPVDRTYDGPGKWLMLTTELSTVEVLNVDAPAKASSSRPTTPGGTNAAAAAAASREEPDHAGAAASSSNAAAPTGADQSAKGSSPPPRPSNEPETYTMRAHTGDCYCIAQRDNFLAVGSKDSLVSIWDLDWCACLRCVTRHVTPVRCVAFSAGARYLASAAYDPGIDVADVETTTKVHHVDHQYSMNALAWHPREDILAYAIDTKVNSLGVSSFATKPPTWREGTEEAPYIALLHAPKSEAGDRDDTMDVDDGGPLDDDDEDDRDLDDAVVAASPSSRRRHHAHH